MTMWSVLLPAQVYMCSPYLSLSSLVELPTKNPSESEMSAYSMFPSIVLHYPYQGCACSTKGVDLENAKPVLTPLCFFCNLQQSADYTLGQVPC